MQRLAGWKGKRRLGREDPGICVKCEEGVWCRCPIDDKSKGLEGPLRVVKGDIKMVRHRTACTLIMERQATVEGQTL